MQYSDLESWQIEEIAERVHEMVGFFTRLKNRMEEKKFPRDRMYDVIVEAADKTQTAWVHLHYLACDTGRRERDKFGERKKRPK